MHPSHVQCKRRGLNAQITVNTQKDSNGTVKSNFVTSCLTFKVQSHQMIHDQGYFVYIHNLYICVLHK